MGQVPAPQCRGGGALAEAAHDLEAPGEGVAGLREQRVDTVLEPFARHRRSSDRQRRGDVGHALVAVRHDRGGAAAHHRFECRVDLGHDGRERQPVLAERGAQPCTIGGGWLTSDEQVSERAEGEHVERHPVGIGVGERLRGQVGLGRRVTDDQLHGAGGRHRQPTDPGVGRVGRRDRVGLLGRERQVGEQRHDRARVVRPAGLEPHRLRGQHPVRDAPLVDLAQRAGELLDQAERLGQRKLGWQLPEEKVEASPRRIVVEDDRRAEVGLVEVNGIHDAIEAPQALRRGALAMRRVLERAGLLGAHARDVGVDAHPGPTVGVLVLGGEVLRVAALGERRQIQHVGAGRAGRGGAADADAVHCLHEQLGLLLADPLELRVTGLLGADGDERVGDAGEPAAVLAVSDRDLGAQFGRELDPQVGVGEPDQWLEEDRARSAAVRAAMPAVANQAREGAHLLGGQVGGVGVRLTSSVGAHLGPAALVAVHDPGPCLHFDDEPALGSDDECVHLVDAAAVGELEVGPRLERRCVGEQLTQLVERVGLPRVLGLTDLSPPLRIGLHHSPSDL